MMKSSWACTKELLHLACSSPYKDVEHYGTFTASSQHVSNMYVYTSSTRTRRGGSCLRVILEVFFIYRTCIRRAPARPLRACFVRTCCTVAVQEQDLRAAPVQCNAKQTLSSRVTLRTPLFTPRTPHFTLALHTPQFISTHLI